ncbi:MAG: phosphoribosyltransferase [Candidatus Aenigmatarchaeota archaeon]
MKKDVKVLYVTWNKFHNSIVDIAHKIKRDRFNPDIVYGILKGGIIPARLLADVINVENIGFIGIKFYKKIGISETRPKIFLPPTSSVKNLKVLLVDDVADSGKTLEVALKKLKKFKPKEVKTAVIYLKPWCSFLPDYYYKITNKWVVFPWEISEVLRENVNVAEVKKIIKFAKKLGII